MTIEDNKHLKSIVMRFEESDEFKKINEIDGMHYYEGVNIVSDKTDLIRVGEDLRKSLTTDYDTELGASISVFENVETLKNLYKPQTFIRSIFKESWTDGSSKYAEIKKNINPYILKKGGIYKFENRSSWSSDTKIFKILGSEEKSLVMQTVTFDDYGKSYESFMGSDVVSRSFDSKWICEGEVANEGDIEKFNNEIKRVSSINLELVTKFELGKYYQIGDNSAIKVLFKSSFCIIYGLIENFTGMYSDKRDNIYSSVEKRTSINNSYSIFKEDPNRELTDKEIEYFESKMVKHKF